MAFLGREREHEQGKVNGSSGFTRKLRGQSGIHRQNHTRSRLIGDAQRSWLTCPTTHRYKWKI